MKIEFNENGIAIAYGHIDFDDTIDMPIGTYTKCYSTGAYTVYEEDCNLVYCKSEFGNFMLELSDHDQTFQLTHISGDIEKIKEIVKNELDCFDSEVRWV